VSTTHGFRFYMYSNDGKKLPMVSISRTLLWVMPTILAASVSGDVLYAGKTTAVEELNVTSFRDMITNDMSERTWVVVFYAHWCGHCQSFASTFIKMAESMSAHPTLLRFAAVDCASPSSSKLGDVDICAQNDIRMYPSILEFQKGVMTRDLPIDEKDLDQKLSLILKDAGVEKTANESSPSVGRSQSRTLPETPSSVIHDSDLALRTILSEYVFQGGSKILDATRSSHLTRLLTICSKIHLPDHIRTGCANLLPSVTPDLSLRTWKRLLITESLSKGRDRFESCTSFSCGLWRLLHLITLSVVPDETTEELITFSRLRSDHSPLLLPAAEAMESIRFIVDNYFTCTVCRKHFLQHYDNCDFGRCQPPSGISVPFWLFELHNGVNRRLENPVWLEKVTPSEAFLKLRALYGLDGSSMGGGLMGPDSMLVVGLAICGLLAMLYKLASIRIAIDRFKNAFIKKYQPII
jgi:thiol-disulfide isomerase/thioredoxin